ncbi:MAG TPA: VWA domain-containing protein [Gaiellaceae bacterium]|nr:VWA domain-containing protein [Gaiellaceae bacterium]
MTLSLLTPIGVLLAIGLVVPLISLLRARARADRVRAQLGVESPARRRLAAPVTGLVLGGLLLGLAAAQPVVAWTTDRRIRTDAEAFVVLDVSRSMLAQKSLDDPMRIERAKAAATTIRTTLSDVPVGVASLTDRILPHLFPSTDGDVFAATLERSVGIEQPPPRSSFLTGATSLNALATLRGLRYFRPTSEKRLAVVLTDGETQPVANARIGGLFRQVPPIEVVFVHFWDEDEQVFSRGVPEPQYIPDPSARSALDRLAASAKGTAYAESDIDAAARKARELLGGGPTVIEGKRAGEVALAPYLAAAALLPFGLLLWQRDR